MKKVLTISLALLLLLLSARDLLTFAAFKFQQDTIAAELCVSKYEEIPMCFGECFLDQQIKINKSQEDRTNDALPPDLNPKSVFFLSWFPVYSFDNEIPEKNSAFQYQSMRSQIHQRKILKPPRFG